MIKEYLQDVKGLSMKQRIAAIMVVVFTVWATGTALAQNGVWAWPYSGTQASATTSFAVYNTGTGSTLYASSASAYGVFGDSTSGIGVFGRSATSGSVGVNGQNTATSGIAVGTEGIATSSSGGIGIYGTGEAEGVYGTTSSSSGYGVYGINTATSDPSGNSVGVYGAGGSYGTGVYGTGPTNGVYGVTTGNNTGCAGVYGSCSTANGLAGLFTGTGGGIVLRLQPSLSTASSNPTLQIEGYSTTQGAYIDSQSGIGLIVSNQSGATGSYPNCELVTKSTTADALFCKGTSYKAINIASDDGNAIETLGDVYIDGGLSVTGAITAGTKDFLIDDPIDPKHKTLRHSCVESDKDSTMYTGKVVIDNHGEAVVSLAKWNQALNEDYTYQLTCVGGNAPVYIAEEVHNNQFKIAGGEPGMKVCWLLTGVRHDAFAKNHPLVIEALKSTKH